MLFYNLKKKRCDFFSYILLDSVHQGVDKTFRWAPITFCVTNNSQWASPTARCGLDRAARSVTVASRRRNLCTSLCTRLWYWLLIDRYPTSGALTSTSKTSTILHSDSKIPWNSQNHRMRVRGFSYYSIKFERYRNWGQSAMYFEKTNGLKALVIWYNTG